MVFVCAEPQESSVPPPWEGDSWTGGRVSMLADPRPGGCSHLCFRRPCTHISASPPALRLPLVPFEFGTSGGCKRDRLISPSTLETQRDGDPRAGRPDAQAALVVPPQRPAPDFLAVADRLPGREAHRLRIWALDSTMDTIIIIANFPVLWFCLIPTLELSPLILNNPTQ